MHESGMARRLLEAVLAVAAERRLRRVTGVEVEAGPVAVPSADALAFHFGLAAAGTLAEGATLRVTYVVDDPAVLSLVAVEVDDGG